MSDTETGCCKGQPGVPRMHVHTTSRPGPTPDDLAAEAEDLAARVADAEDRQAAAAPRHNPLAPGCEEGGSAWLHGQRCRPCEAPAARLDPRLVATLRAAGDEWGPMGVTLAMLDLHPLLRSSLLTRLAAEARAHTPPPLPEHDARITAAVNRLTAGDLPPTPWDPFAAPSPAERADWYASLPRDAQEAVWTLRDATQTEVTRCFAEGHTPAADVAQATADAYRRGHADGYAAARPQTCDEVHPESAVYHPDGHAPAPTPEPPAPITYPRDDSRTPGPRWCRIHGTGRCTRTCHGRKPATSDARAADPMADYR